MARRHRHRQTDRKMDLYQTALPAVYGLIRYETLPHKIWEPSCGPGNIVKVLRSEGHDVFASDLQDYGSPHQDMAGVDFLQQTALPRPGIEAIVQNPPYYAADECAALALELAPKSYCLMRLAWLESEKRRQWFKQGYLRKVLVFSNRLPMMHREGWKGKKTSSTTAYAWFCFDRDNRGPCEINWIEWVPLTAAQSLAMDVKRDSGVQNRKAG